MKSATRSEWSDIEGDEVGGAKFFAESDHGIGAEEDVDVNDKPDSGAKVDVHHEAEEKDEAGVADDTGAKDEDTGAEDEVGVGNEIDHAGPNAKTGIRVIDNTNEWHESES